MMRRRRFARLTELGGLLRCWWTRATNVLSTQLAPHTLASSLAHTFPRLWNRFRHLHTEDKQAGRQAEQKGQPNPPPFQAIRCISQKRGNRVDMWFLVCIYTRTRFRGFPWNDDDDDAERAKKVKVMERSTVINSSFVADLVMVFRQCDRFPRLRNLDTKGVVRHVAARIAGPRGYGEQGKNQTRSLIRSSTWTAQ